MTFVGASSGIEKTDGSFAAPKQTVWEMSNVHKGFLHRTNEQMDSYSEISEKCHNVSCIVSQPSVRGASLAK